MIQKRNERATQAWILALTGLSSFMISLDSLVVSTTLPVIRLHLGASIEQLEWTVNAYTLSFAVLLMTGAALGDRFGRRRMFVVGLGVFVAASAACALARNVSWLIAARAVQGSGAALVMPLAMTLLSAAFEPAQRGRALGIFGSVTGLAVLSGPLVGGAIAQGLAWQWIFWLNVPIGLLVIALVLLRVPESFGPRTALDVVGLLLVTGASLGGAWGLVRGNNAGWSSFEVEVSLVIGFLLLVAFIVWEVRSRVPMVPMRFFRSRTFSASNAIGFLLFASLYGTNFFLAQFLQTSQGYGPLASGLRLLPSTATLFVVAPIAGSLINRLGERSLIVGGLLLQASGLAWIALIARPDLIYTGLVVPLIVSGIGVSMAMPAAQTAVVSAVAPHEIGKASGTFNMLRFLGGVFGVAIPAAVFAGIGSYSTPQAFSHGFVPAISVCAALALVGAIVGMLLPGRRAMTSARSSMPSKPSEQQETDGLPERSASL